jgi:3-oxoacyl-[acyl-carrier protein] reductase
MAKSVLITGASADIGHSIALELAQADFALALHYRHNARAVAALQQTLSAQGCANLAMRYDLTRPDQAKAKVEETVGAFGRLDAVVNVVGPFHYRDITETTPEEWQETIALNLHTCFNVTHHAQPYLCEAKGHIVNFAFAGVENLKAWPQSAAYCAAKAGVAVLTKSWAAALAPQGVRVNALCPGLVEEGAATEAERKAMAEQIPLGRPVRPQEVAATVKWLLTGSPASMTGSLIAVSGAWEY